MRTAQMRVKNIESDAITALRHAFPLAIKVEERKAKGTPFQSAPNVL